jgi:hypothetical protein
VPGPLAGLTTMVKLRLEWLAILSKVSAGTHLKDVIVGGGRSKQWFPSPRGRVDIEGDQNGRLRGSGFSHLGEFDADRDDDC